MRTLPEPDLRHNFPKPSLDNFGRPDRDRWIINGTGCNLDIYDVNLTETKE